MIEIKIKIINETLQEMSAAPTIKSPFYMPRNSVQATPLNTVQNRIVEKTRAYGGGVNLTSSVASADTQEQKVARVEEETSAVAPMQQEEEVAPEVKAMKREVEEALSSTPQNLGKQWTVADARGNLINMVPRADANLGEFQKLFPHLKPIDAPIDFTGVAEEKKAEHEELVKKARAHDLQQAYNKYLRQKEVEQKELLIQKVLDEKLKPLIEEENRKNAYDPVVAAVTDAAKAQSLPMLDGFQSLVMSAASANENHKRTHSALEKQLQYTNSLEFKNKELSTKLKEQEKRIKELEAKVAGPKVPYYASQVESAKPAPRIVESAASAKRGREDEMEEDDSPESFIAGVFSRGNYARQVIDPREFSQNFAQNIAAGYGAASTIF